MNKKENFVAKARAVHGNKYDYTNSVYVNSYTKLTVTCPKHGSFEQEPNNHIGRKSGCRACATEVRTKPFEQFEEQAREIHNDFFDYSLTKTDYTRAKTPVRITCPKHGTFKQTPDNHLRGKNGCKTCKAEKLSKQNATPTQEWIAKAREIHGDVYDYSKVVYKNENSKLTITCPKHGAFKKSARSHLNGAGCTTCTNERLSREKRRSFEEFEEKAKEMHGDFYDYSKVAFKNDKSSIQIICPVHGAFRQIVRAHLTGGRCPKCRTKASSGELMVRKVLEKLEVKFYEQVKMDGCKDKSCLIFDFHLPDHNLLIEYDGKQHFQAIPFFGGVSGFNATKTRDGIKNDYAAQNGIKLLRISYKEKRSIEKILKDALQS